MIALVFEALNSYLGNAVGEFLGELALYGSMLAFAVASRRVGSRWIAGLGMVTGVAGWIAMFRNITAAVLPISSLTNLLLPIYLVAFGVWLMRDRAPRSSEA